MKAERVDSLSSIGDQWNHLVRNSNVKSIFQTYEWIVTWWKHFGGEKELYLLVASDNDQIVGIAPLMKDKIRFKGVPLFKGLQFIGTPISDYADFILKAGLEVEILKCFADYLMKDKKNWDIIVLSDVREDSFTNRYLPGILAQSGHSYYADVRDVCPYIDLPSSWEEYKALLGRMTRANINRFLKRLQRQGDLQFVRVADRNNIIPAMDEYFRVLGLGQDQTDTRGTLLCNFFRDVSKELFDHVALFFLELDGKAIAAMYCYDYEKIRYYYGLGWDRTYARCSPGFITIIKAIEDTINNGFKRFDFLRGDEYYKNHFTKTEKKNTKYFISHLRRKLNGYRFMIKLSSLKRKYAR